jgi:hypothetical protein
MAYFFDKKKVIDFLIHSGADTTILNKDGLAPSQVTRFKKRKKSIVKYHNLAKRTRSTMLRRRDELPCLTDTSSSSSSSSPVALDNTLHIAFCMFTQSDRD